MTPAAPPLSRTPRGLLILLAVLALPADGKSVAYIHGDIAADGTIPSGAAAPFHQMLLTDTGTLGCSEFAALVTAEGYTIAQYYDQATTLNAAFLRPFDVIVFGLHQKIWSAAEKATLDDWIRNGGGILMFSDSASGGSFSQVGIRNATGQTAVNNILTAYGMQVTVDQGGGIRAYTSDADACSPIVWDQPDFEGEGVSPVAVDPAGGAEVLIPFDSAHQVSGGGLTLDTRNITIANPLWAAIGQRRIGEGNVIAIFDRQPLWNAGPGSSIQQRDNREVLRRIVKSLARDYGNSKEWFNLGAARRINPSDGKSYLEVSYRQWAGGSGPVGADYAARNAIFRVDYSPDLAGGGSWTSGPSLVEQVGPAIDRGDGSETVTVRVLPASDDNPRGFARLTVACANGSMPDTLTVDAGRDVTIAETGAAWLEGSVAGSPIVTTTWTKSIGPGTVTFTDAGAPTTSAIFSAPGAYELALTADNGTGQFSDAVSVFVAATGAIVRAINCGGGAYAGTNGISYEADTLFTGGNVDAFPGNAVAGTADDALYNFARSGHSAYTIPVPDGNYLVVLQFAETFFTSENSRVFDTSIEGTLVLDDLDLVATAPGKWVAYDRAFSTPVMTGGQLNLTFSSSVNNALLNGIVVISQ